MPEEENDQYSTWHLRSVSVRLPQGFTFFLLEHYAKCMNKGPFAKVYNPAARAKSSDQSVYQVGDWLGIRSKMGCLHERADAASHTDAARATDSPILGLAFNGPSAAEQGNTHKVMVTVRNANVDPPGMGPVYQQLVTTVWVKPMVEEQAKAVSVLRGPHAKCMIRELLLTESRPLNPGQCSPASFLAQMLEEHSQRPIGWEGLLQKAISWLPMSTLEITKFRNAVNEVFNLEPIKGRLTDNHNFWISQHLSDKQQVVHVEWASIARANLPRGKGKGRGKGRGAQDRSRPYVDGNKRWQ